MRIYPEGPRPSGDEGSNKQARNLRDCKKRRGTKKTGGEKGVIDGRLQNFFKHLERAWVGIFWRGKSYHEIDRDAERRRYPRVPSHNLVKVIRANGRRENLIYNLTDVSETGFQFAGLSRFQSGICLQIVVNIREFNRQIPMDARIVWSQPITAKVVWGEYGERSRLHQAGAEIVEISEADRYALRGFIHYKLQNLQ